MALQHQDDGAPPEAELIRRRREELVPPRSPEKLARLIGLSGKRWRDIERGLDANGRPTRARSNTLAEIARQVGITPEELAEHGRPDGARLLTAMLKEQVAVEPTLSAFVDTEATPIVLLQEILQVLDEIRNDGRLSASQREQLEQSFVLGLQRDVRNLHDQFRTMIRVVGNER